MVTIQASAAGALFTKIKVMASSNQSLPGLLIGRHWLGEKGGVDHLVLLSLLHQYLIFIQAGVPVEMCLYHVNNSNHKNSPRLNV